MFSLEMAVDDAIFRIRREYKRTNGKIYLGYSGGKDSEVVGRLIEMAELPAPIPWVFANTRIEFDAQLKHVKNHPYKKDIIILKPRKPFGQILKEYGKPAISKNKANMLKTYQKHIDEPLKTFRARTLITGEVEKGGVKAGTKSRFALADKDFHFLHPDLGYKVANMCCSYMKKYPFEDYAKDNDMAGAFSGVRTAEGGVRASAYKSCVHVKKKANGKEFVMSMPIIDWSDELVEEFIQKYDVILSEAYTKYGCERTGCVGCPFALDHRIKQELEAVYIHEPNRYKAAISWLGDVYMDQGIELEFDENYMEKFKERSKRNEEMRQEMLNKFYDVRLKNKDKPKQMDIGEFIDI